MFKIYSLALLSFLSLQNGYAADQREKLPENFPGAAKMKYLVEGQQRDLENLKNSINKAFQGHKESVSRFLTNTSDSSPTEEKNSLSLMGDISPILEFQEKIRDLEHHVESFKKKLYQESLYVAEKRHYEIKEFEEKIEKQKQKMEEYQSKQERDFKYELEKKDRDFKCELEKQKWQAERQLKDQEKIFEDQINRQKRMFEEQVEEIIRKEATKYRQLGITSLLKGRNEESLPSQERSPYISLNDFPLTFDHHDDNSCSVYLKLSEEDQESLRASGVNQDLIDNLFSHLQTDVSALYDMVQRGYRNRQEQNRQ